MNDTEIDTIINDDSVMKSNDINTEEIDKKIKEAYENAEQISLVMVLKLIYLTSGLDLSKDYGMKYSFSSKKSNKLKSGEVILLNKSNNIKNKIYLDIVNKNYDLMDSMKNSNLISNDTDTFNDIEENLKNQIIHIISHLTQACLLIFNNLKNKYSELLEYNLMLDDNTTIYLDYDLDQRIGIHFNLTN